MIHWDCTIGDGCPTLDIARLRMRIDQPVDPALGIACERCWRIMHGQLPLVPTTSPDLAPYADDPDAAPSFLGRLADQRRRLTA